MSSKVLGLDEFPFEISSLPVIHHGADSGSFSSSFELCSNWVFLNAFHVVIMEPLSEKGQELLDPLPSLNFR